LEIATPSDRYLPQYLGKDNEIPPIGPENVMRSAGLIEQMGKGKMRPRRE